MTAGGADRSPRLTRILETARGDPPAAFAAVLALVGVVVWLPLWLAGSAYADWPLRLVVVGGGVPLVAALVQKAFLGEFGSDFLAAVSIAVSVWLGEWVAGAVIVLMLSGGALLETYAVRSASSALESLAKRLPAHAHKRIAEKIVETPLAEIAVGDEFMVFPHEACPVDGEVSEGRGWMDESYLTGEPYRVDKAPGSAVLSGAMNGAHALTIRATKLAVDSRYAKIMEVMRKAEQERPRMRRLADTLGGWYTPVALAVALLAWWASGDPRRFLAVLVIATPCPLLVAIPIAIIGAVSLAASRGIVIRRPAVLEKIDGCTTAIFDKTGTLTYGRPTLVTVDLGEDFQEDDVLRLAAGLEKYSKHPLALAIVEAGERKRLPAPEVSKVSERPGQGLTGVVDGRAVRVTSRQKIAASEPAIFALLPPESGGLECIVLVDGKFAARCQFLDEPRAEGKQFVSHLGPKHAFDRVLIVSGDRESEVRRLAGRVGVTEVYGGQSPEQKVEIVKRESARAPTLFLGDGVNDAPALASATVGIAFGQNSDVTAEAASAVVLESSLAKVDELFHIGKRLRNIALQSAVGGMAVSMLGMFAAACGWLTPTAGALLQEVVDIAAIGNALRTSWPPRVLTDLRTAVDPTREQRVHG